MSVFEGLALSYLHGLGYTTYPPGEAPLILPPLPPLTPDQMAGALGIAGWTVLPPGVLPPAPPLETMIELVRAEDFAVIKRTEPPPALGRWAPPEDAKGKRAHPRTVKAIVGRDVTYDCEGTQHTCRIGTFHAWRRNHEAVHVPDAAVAEAAACSGQDLACDVPARE